VAVVVVVGLAVPGIVLVANGNDKASVGPDNMHLNKEEVAGKELFAKTCFYCHALRGASSYGRTGPDLDVLLAHMSSAERRKYVELAIEQGEAHGRGQMPALLYQGREAKQVAKFVAAVAGVGIHGESTEPSGYPELENKAEGEQAIAAEKEAQGQLTPAEMAKGKEVFSTNCSACHTLAAAEATGTIGPNLDKLQPGEFKVYHQVYTGGGLMPKFGVEHLLTPTEIEHVARYVSSVAGTK
jgi:mono/diheme cytochrome c family protein